MRREPRSDRQRLRRTTLVSAPLFLVALMASAAVVALSSWAVWNPDELGPLAYGVLGASAAVAIAGFVAAAGCFVELRGSELRDVVGWVTVRRVERPRIQHARVRAGAWRWFELELDDGSKVLLAGACPAQLPARLSGDWRTRDLADLDLLLGDA